MFKVFKRKPRPTQKILNIVLNRNLFKGNMEVSLWIIHSQGLITNEELDNTLTELRKVPGSMEESFYRNWGELPYVTLKDEPRPDIRFRGRLLAENETVAIYITQKGNYVVKRAGNAAIKVETQQAVVYCLGVNKATRELFDAAGINYTKEIT